MSWADAAIRMNINPLTAREQPHWGMNTRIRVFECGGVPNDTVYGCALDGVCDARKDFIGVWVKMKGFENVHKIMLPTMPLLNDLTFRLG